MPVRRSARSRISMACSISTGYLACLPSSQFAYRITAWEARQIVGPDTGIPLWPRLLGPTLAADRQFAAGREWLDSTAVHAGLKEHASFAAAGAASEVPAHRRQGVILAPSDAPRR